MGNERRLEVDDGSLRSSASEKQACVHFARTVSKTQEYGGSEELRNENVARDSFAVGEEPRDLFLRKGQGHLSGRF